MSGKITVSSEIPLIIANVVPFLINHNGEANTQTYFTPMKKELPTGMTEAQFRGLKLLGNDCALGEKTGYVCSVSEFLVPDPSGSGEPVTCKQFVATHKIDKLIAYGHEAPPPLQSKYKMIQELDLISDAVHS